MTRIMLVDDDPQYALRMLAAGAPVTAVAHACGSSSTSAFIDVFRRAFGYTPGAANRRP
jgi:AraC-like DNA-binding protein